MNLIIYFTGTGNTLHCAKILKEEIEDTDLLRLTYKTDLNDLKNRLEEYDTIGILAPVYAGTIPYMLTDLLDTIKFRKNVYLYSIATCGGSELAFHMDIEKIIRRTSNRSLDNYFTLKYPSNFQTNSAPKSDQECRKIIDTAKISCKEIAKEILLKNTKNIKVNHPLSFLAKISLDIFVNKKRDKNYWVEDSCISCKACKKVCPANNIDFKEEKPQWLGKCESCMACIEICPVKAIQYKEKTKNWGRYINFDIENKELFV